jgi:arginine utilization protein RocB
MRSKEILKIFKRLQEVRGITGTREEREIAEVVFQCFAEMSYFKNNPGRLIRSEIPGDFLERFNVSAFYKNPKPSEKTIILTGHMDVVDIEGFKHLSSLAFDYEAYTSHVQELKISKEAEADLQSGEWIFGRGVADMRFGLAIAIEIMKEFMEQEEFSGNLLFLGVVGEESNSEGMRHAVRYLQDLKTSFKLDFRALLLFESFLDSPKIPSRKYIHIGACGKLMPFFLAIGESHHASIPSSGFDSSVVIAEIISAMCFQLDLSMESHGKTAPPPSCLKYGDLTKGYSASTPLHGLAYFNMVTLEEKPDEIMETLLELSRKSVSEVATRIIHKRNRSEEKGGKTKRDISDDVGIFTYKEVYKRALRNHGEKIEKEVNQVYETMRSSGKTIQDISIAIVQRVFDRSGIKPPALLVGYLPPYYTSKFPDESDPKVKHVLSLVDQLSSYAKSKFNEDLVRDDFYMGVSDLSFSYGLGEENISGVMNNIPGCDLLFPIPEKEMKDLNIPGVIIGTYGKDFHTPTERLHLRYALEVVPELHRFAINQLMESDY